MCLLRAGDEMMMAEAKTCQNVYNVPRKGYDSRQCVADCQNTFGAAATRRCSA